MRAEGVGANVVTAGGGGSRRATGRSPKAAAGGSESFETSAAAVWTAINKSRHIARLERVSFTLFVSVYDARTQDEHDTAKKWSRVAE